MGDSTISGLDPASLPLSSEAVPCVQGGQNKQAPAAAFGIPAVGRTPPPALAQYQTWIDERTAPPTLRMYIVDTWQALYTIGNDGTLSLTQPLTLPGDPSSDNQAATQQYVDDTRSSAPGALLFKGLKDCSTAPNYPDANQGDFYVVSLPGKIGGASGLDVEGGDTLFCRVDHTASGDQTSAGANWTVGQGKIEGAVVGPASTTDGDFALFDGTSGTLLKDGGLSLDTDATMAADSDARIPSQKAVRSSIGGKLLSGDTLGQGQVWAWDNFSSSFKAGEGEGRNFLVNSAFDIWQELPGYTLNSTVPKTHIADYWKAGAENTNGRTVVKAAGPFNSTFAAMFIRAHGLADAGKFHLAQQLELPESQFLAGKTVTVSFDFAVGATYTATSGPYVTIYYGTGLNEDIDLRNAVPNFGTGGGSVTSPNLASQVASHPSYSRIVSGPLTIAAGVSEVAIDIHTGAYDDGTPASTDDTFMIGNVKLEVGSVATPYRKRDFAEELYRCQWRYQKSFGLGLPPSAGYGAGQGQYMFRRIGSGTASEGGWLQFGTRMRDVPAITLYNSGPGVMNNQVRNETANADCSASAVDNITETGFRVTCTGNAMGAPGDWLSVQWAADKRL